MNPPKYDLADTVYWNTPTGRQISGVVQCVDPFNGYWVYDVVLTETSGSKYVLYKAPEEEISPRTEAEEKETTEAETERYTYRAELLDEAKRIVTQDRNKSYGPPDEDFTRTAELWTAVLGYQFNAKDVAVCMMLLKISRLTWNPSHKDCWVDIAGYAACGYETVMLNADGDR